MDWKTTIKKNLGENAYRYIFSRARFDGGVFFFDEPDLYNSAMRFNGDIKRLFPHSYIHLTVRA